MDALRKMPTTIVLWENLETVLVPSLRTGTVLPTSEKAFIDRTEQAILAGMCTAMV